MIWRVLRMLGTTRPFEDRRTWMLHGRLATSMTEVPLAEATVEQIRLPTALGGGSFPDLLRPITIDRGGAPPPRRDTSTASAPAENDGRELLEPGRRHDEIPLLARPSAQRGSRSRSIGSARLR